MMYLITGAIGTGKTTYVVDQLMQIDQDNQKHKANGELDKVRQIYSNIDGLTIEHEELPEDWRTTPKNSVIAIDECHKIQIYKPNRKHLHDDERIIALNESRHTGHDIYFITQAPSFIHNHVKGLINQHFHFHNPMGLGASTVFMWRHGKTNNPDSQTSKNLAENEFVYTFKKDVQKNFKSVEDDAKHTRKVRIPKKIFFMLGALVCMISLIAYLLSKPTTTGVITGENFTKAADKKQDDISKGVDAVNNMQSFGKSGSPDLSKECRKGINVEKPECVKWFDELTKNGGSVSDPDNQTVAYDPKDPFGSADKIQEQVAYQVTAKPVFSGCIYKNGKYVAYTQQGTVIHDFPQSDCKRLVQDSDRPFNYFAQQEQNQAQQQQQPQNQQQQLSSRLTSEEIDKYRAAKEQGLI